jgi:hypothetical protein
VRKIVLDFVTPELAKYGASTRTRGAAAAVGRGVTPAA